MPLSNEKIVASYDMDADAMGLAGFIDKQFANYPNAVVVYVEDQHGNPVTKAEWAETKLTDGGKVYNLRLTIDGE